MTKSGKVETTQQRLLRELRHHFKGWLTKIEADLSPESFAKEIKNLKSDKVYSSFGLDTPEYALVRVMGRVSISIGRRLGEIYDKMPRFVAQARFELSAEDVAPIIGGLLELDVCIPYAKLKAEDRQPAIKIVAEFVKGCEGDKAAAIEIRYNFNPNDSSRLRKDEEMARLLKEQKMTPIYLVFSTISPRDEAISRLKKAGWTFLIGDKATEFMNKLIGMNIGELLDAPDVQKEVRREIGAIMKTLYSSAAVRETVGLHADKTAVNDESTTAERKP